MTKTTENFKLESSQLSVQDSAELKHSRNMNNLETLITILKEKQSNFKEKYHIQQLGIFGSYVRGEEKPDSDLDILVEFESGYHFGLLTFCQLENYLSDLLGVKVDLVMKDSLKPKIGQQILSEVIYL